jgi:membrane fusion protein (multidrug efflux system)
MRRRLAVVLASTVLLLGGIVGFNLFKAHMIRKVMAKNASPAQTVSTTIIEYSKWQPQVKAVGSLRAVHGVQVTTEVAGLVRSVDFKSGQDVRAGQALVQLNAAPDIAQLRALTAEANLAGLVYHRDLIQYQAQAISRAQLDTDEANLKSAQDQEAAQAALVAKKTVLAPFSGRLGITTVNPGQYLNPGDAIVSLEALDPIYVDFMLPQDELARVASGQSVHVTTSTFGDQGFQGKITSIDPLVNPSTRNFEAEATIPNPGHRLLPGMFVRVAVDAGAPVRYLTLPQTAIAYNPYGETVFLVRNAGSAHATVELTFVTLGPTRGDQVAVVKGLKQGDVVVTSGQMKLKNGTRILVNNSVQPLDSANPSPQEH